MRCKRDCPLCYSGRRGRKAYKGHWGYRNYVRPIAGEAVMLKKRSGPSGQPGKGSGSFVHSSAEAGVEPTTHEFLCLERWPDGSSRRTGTLLLFVDQGMLKACVTDRDGGLVAFVSGNTLPGLLDALERGLSADTLDWRLMRQQGRGRK